MLRSILITAVLVCAFAVTGQTIISGRVTDASNGSPIPFVNLYLKGTTSGTISDFDGYYELRTSSDSDSLIASYVGYHTRTFPVIPGLNQVLNVQLEEDVISLSEVVVIAGENPAWQIMRDVITSKGQNDKRSLEAYEYESYTKIEVDIDQLTEEFSRGKVVRRITAVMDSIERIAGEDGNPVLPLLFTESISRFYYKKQPTFRYENILKTKVSGVGTTDGTLTSQFIGSTFQEYNFYQNWLNILDKEFVSPIADGWKGFYEYYLVDSLQLDDDFVYKVEFQPKREQDLAFTGTLWITKSDNAVKQLDAVVTKSANLNFIEKIRIQQELSRSEAGAWLPLKTRVLLDISQLQKDSPGLLAKFYVSNRDVKVNSPYDDSFYSIPIKTEEDVREDNEEYWSAIRHDSLTSTEINVYRMIDTLKTDPFIRNVSGLSRFAFNTYLPVGIIDIGPYTTFFANNNVEQIRAGLGFRTNIKFSKKWVLAANAGYGFGDERWKYDFSIKHIFKREPWTTLSFQRRYEIDPVWILNDEISPLSLFYTFSRFGTLSAPFSHYVNSVDFITQPGRGWTSRILIKQQQFVPEYDFSYYLNPEGTPGITASEMQTTEVNLEVRYAKDELFIISDNERLSLGPVRYPAITFRYTAGLQDVFGSDFSYHKIHAEVFKRQKMGVFGVSNIQLTGGYIFNSLPYPLLKAHIGNQTPFYIGFAYNLMDFYEFTTDQYASLRIRHQFQGLILNRIPLMKRLKWRLTGTANVLYGAIRDENIERVVLIDDGSGNQVMPFRVMNQGPYLELGYGIENIFKFFRVDAFHRLSYLDQPGVRKFGLKFTVQAIL